MRLLRGKLGGLIAFLAIAALVGGGLGWATHQALELEEARRIAAAQADEADKLRQQQMERAEKLRLALWRLGPNRAGDRHEPGQEQGTRSQPCHSRLRLLGDANEFLRRSTLSVWILSGYERTTALRSSG